MATENPVPEAAVAAEAAAAPKTSSGRRSKRVEARGQAYVQSTFNNTIVTICDSKGHAIAWEIGRASCRERVYVLV